MIKVGEPPFLECSSKGDKRFSAFYARLKLFNKTIEELYQSSKIFEDGTTNLSIKDAKGRKAINQEKLNELYSSLWDLYFYENPNLLDIVNQYKGFTDIFGQKGHCYQAIEIYRIAKLNTIKEGYNGTF